MCCLTFSRVCVYSCIYAAFFLYINIHKLLWKADKKEDHDKPSLGISDRNWSCCQYKGI